jgi:hypothetical protein
MATKKKAKKKTVRKKSAAGKKTIAKKKLVKKKKKKSSPASAQRRQKASPSRYSVRRSGRTGAAGEQSGDLQGLSTAERADSESVDELLQEGNAFEAGVVEGVEDAEARSERGVHTREVPEDDVPEEYLDRDE